MRRERVRTMDEGGVEAVLVVGGHEVDVRIVGASGSAVGDLVAALVGGPAAPSTGLLVDGRFAPPGLPAGDAGLRRGSVLALAPPPPASPAAGPLAPASSAAVDACGVTPYHRHPAPPPPGPGPSPRPPGRQAEPPVPARPGWAGIIAPLAVGLVMAVLVNPMLAAFALLSPVMALATWFEDRRRHRRAVADMERSDAAAVAAFTSALAAGAAAEAERQRLVLGRGADPGSESSVPLWGRRPGHPAFGRVTVGIGDRRWQAAADESSGGDVVRGVAAAIASHAVLREVPVPGDLGAGAGIGVVGDRRAALAVARAIVIDACTHHGPVDLSVVVEAGSGVEWEWVRWLPHSGTSGSTSAARLRLTVADGSSSVSPGAVVLAIAAEGGPLPFGVGTVVELRGSGAARVTDTTMGEVVDDVVPCALGREDARRLARAMARWSDPLASGPPLPRRVALGTVLHGGVTPAELAARWSAGDGHPPLVAVLGSGPDGPLAVDLDADGPHALVGGTTGSGKSELLRTLLVSLAWRCSPDDVGFLLIDYKGGAAFDDIVDLPHTVGLVTDLDSRLASRALRSLEAELRHREALLREAGASSLAEYAVRRAGSDLAPLGRLVVVVDEFATLVADVPDFVDALVGVAQRGRSLGVHLILATQRPSGAVSPSVRANTNLRIALRVQDREDSVDVIDVSDAASIPRDTPGRALVRRGHGDVVAFQAAVVDGFADDESVAGVRVTPRASGGVPRAEPDRSMAGLVDGARAAAQQLGIASPRRPWLDPLPGAVSLRSLPRGAAGWVDDPDRQAQRAWSWNPADGNLALYGGPGSKASGVLVALVASIASVTDPASLHVHVIDASGSGSGASELARLPHVGAVIGPAERERQQRAVRQLGDEVARRQRLGVGRGDAPWLVLVVDGLDAFHAGFDDLAGLTVRDTLARIVADGPAVGVSVVLGADRPGAVPASMGASIAQRVVLGLAEPLELAAFGISRDQAPPAGPGRGVLPAPMLEVQFAVDVPEGWIDEVARCSAGVPPSRLAPPVGTMPEAVPVAALAPWAVRRAVDHGKRAWESLVVPVGIADRDLAPAALTLGRGEHLLVAGPPRSGVSSCVRALTALAALANPGLMVLDGAAAARAMDDDGPPTLVVIDDADAWDDADGLLTGRLAQRNRPWWVLAGGRGDAMRTAYGHWTQAVRRSRTGLILRPQPETDGDLFQVAIPRRPSGSELPFGRAWMVGGGAIELVQAAMEPPMEPPMEPATEPAP